MKQHPRNASKRPSNARRKQTVVRAKVAQELTQVTDSEPSSDTLSEPQRAADCTAEPSADGDVLAGVLALLRVRTKVDFGLYRKGTLLRRIQRRMRLKRLERAEDYLALIQDRPEELEALTKDLLIRVTSFFRDREMFEVFEAQVIPALLRGRPGDRPVRVWVPGCATGEEAYSIAMVFLEQAAMAKQAFPIEIFATDIDAGAIEAARRGVYSVSAMADIATERVARFFVRADYHSYQVNKQLREVVTFAQHNLLRDAPFSKLDLVSCRNLLIYLEPEAQRQVVGLLHFALNQGGYLVLGPSESVDAHLDLFEPMSRKGRIYRRAAAVRRRVESRDQERRGALEARAAAGRDCQRAARPHRRFAAAPARTRVEQLSSGTAQRDRRARERERGAEGLQR